MKVALRVQTNCRLSLEGGVFGEKSLGLADQSVLRLLTFITNGANVVET